MDTVFAIPVISRNPNDPSGDSELGVLFALAPRENELIIQEEARRSLRQTRFPEPWEIFLGCIPVPLDILEQWYIQRVYDQDPSEENMLDWEPQEGSTVTLHVVPPVSDEDVEFEDMAETLDAETLSVIEYENRT